MGMGGPLFFAGFVVGVLRGAEVVFLCWQIGEPSVGFWHRIEDGFAGRKPLLDGDSSDPDSKVSYH